MRNIWGFLLLFLISISSSTSALELYLKPLIVERSSRVTLEDIAFRGGENRAVNGKSRDEADILSRELRGIVEKPSLLSSEELRRRIPSSLLQDLILVGGYSIYIPHTVKQDERSIFIDALKKIKPHIHYPIVRVEAAIRTPGTEQISEHKTVVVTPEGENRTVEVDLIGYAEAAVASTSIGRGDTLSRERIRYQIVPVEPGRQNQLLTVTEIPDTYVARTSIDNGEVLERDDVRKTRMVKPGDTVTIHYSRKGVSLTLKGTSYQGGSRGEMVAVKPHNGTKRLMAEVIDISEVYFAGN